MSTVNLFEYKWGLPSEPEFKSFVLSVEDGSLLLQSAKAKLGKPEIRQTYKVPLENIVKFELLTEKEFVDKSVLGRGVVGAFAFGAAGAVVGGMSGFGKKEKPFPALVVSYASNSEPDELKTIVFNTGFSGWHLKNCAQAKQIKKILDGTTPSAIAQNFISSSIHIGGTVSL